MTERFSQDSLENYFGRQQGMGGRKDNPMILDLMIIRYETKKYMDQLVEVMLEEMMIQVLSLQMKKFHVEKSQGDKFIFQKFLLN